jgi:D-arabinose 5-phosphate isomerase GutQ
MACQLRRALRPCGHGSLQRAIASQTNRSRSSTSGGDKGVVDSMLTSLRDDAQAVVRLYEKYSKDRTYQEAASGAVELVHQSVHGGASSARGGAGGGSVFTTGIGKAGVVAKRLSISLASVSVPSQWVHGTEWVHGDLGNLREGDVVVAISHSGKTAELLDLALLLPGRGVPLLAIVGNASSPVSGTSLWHVVDARASVCVCACARVCLRACGCLCVHVRGDAASPRCMHRSLRACMQLAQTATVVLHAPAEGELLECIPSRSLVAQEVRLCACVPACLRACVPACLRACVPACLRACVPACLRACVPACLRACVPACLRACVPACLRACVPFKEHLCVGDFIVWPTSAPMH